MHRSWIIARCCPALLVVAAAACASRGSTTNVTSTGNVARDTAASTTRRDTASTTRRDTASTTRRDTAAAMPTAPTSTAVQLSVADAPGVGAYVTDATGRAVYVIDAPDSATFTCTSACATEFDPIIGQAVIATGTTGLEASQLGTRPLADGRQQATYNGKPLYFSRADAAKGDTKGQGTKSYGNVRLLTPNK
jgi:predicted lipoprotein with Yx(FWY)xxD motif